MKKMFHKLTATIAIILISSCLSIAQITTYSYYCGGGNILTPNVKTVGNWTYSSGYTDPSPQTTPATIAPTQLIVPNYGFTYNFDDAACYCYSNGYDSDGNSTSDYCNLISIGMPTDTLINMQANPFIKFTLSATGSGANLPFGKTDPVKFEVWVKNAADEESDKVTLNLNETGSKDYSLILAGKYASAASFQTIKSILIMFSGCDVGNITGSLFVERILVGDQTKACAITTSTVSKDATSTLTGVFPNPTKSNFSINMTSQSSESVNLYLIDPIGKKIFIKNATCQIGENTIESILPENLPKGLYKLTLEREDGSFNATSIIIN